MGEDLGKGLVQAEDYKCLMLMNVMLLLLVL